GGTAGSGGAGGVPPAGPPGYAIWGDWYGCAWTGVSDLGDDGNPVAGLMSTINPTDFVSKPPEDAFCASGTVDAAYTSVALMGFITAEQPPADCAAKQADPNAPPQPAVTPTNNGIAVDFVKQGASTSFTWRVQLQGPNGH